MPRPAPKAEVWVDAYRGVEGDGSRARPFKRFPADVAADTVVHLASGLYAGPLTLAPGVDLVGHGTAVVSQEGATGAALTVMGGRVENVSVRGGATGVLVKGPSTLVGLHVSSFATQGVLVEATGGLTLERSAVVGTLTNTVGVQVEGAKVSVRDCQFTGALRRGVALAGVPQATLERLSGEGVGSLVHATDSEVTLSTSEAAAGRAAAVFVAGGALTVSGLSVLGHEYALQAVRARVAVDDLVSRDALLAGVAVQRCTGNLARVRVINAGTLGGVQLLDDQDLVLADSSVRGAQATGVMVRVGAVTLNNVTVEEVRREGQVDGEPVLGDGFQLRDARVRASNLVVRDVEGSGVWVSAEADVRAERVEIARTGASGVVVERAARFQVGTLTVHGARGAALLVADRGSAEVQAMTVGGVEFPVWAECDQGARARLGPVEPEAATPLSFCVERLAADAGVPRGR